MPLTAMIFHDGHDPLGIGVILLLNINYFTKHPRTMTNQDKSKICYQTRGKNVNMSNLKE